MARDYAKKSALRKNPVKRRQTRSPHASEHPPTTKTAALLWYIGGLLSGVFLSFLLYLNTVQPDATPSTADKPTAVASVKNNSVEKPRFDFYTLLPAQTIDIDIDPEEMRAKRKNTDMRHYLLQAGSFKQRDDANRRRAELLLLGLDPKVEETNGSHGHWYRVYVGPFATRSLLAKAQSLTAAQGIDTLLLKRNSD